MVGRLGRTRIKGIPLVTGLPNSCSNALFPFQVSKLVYASRTIPEIEKVLEELKTLIKYQNEHQTDDDGSGNATRIVGLALSSRKNLCINADVAKERDGKVVDAKCHALVAPQVRERYHRGASQDQVQICSFYEVG